MEKKRGQVSFEYLILMGFVTLILAVILGIAFFYTHGIEDRVRVSQVNSFANKVISSSEYIFSAGEPSKTTIKAYLPEGVTNVTITEQTLVISLQTSSGLNKIGFPSDVNITGSITETPGLKKLEIVAGTSSVTITPV